MDRPPSIPTMDFQMTRVRSASGREQKRILQSKIFLRLQDVIVCDAASHQACFLRLDGAMSLDKRT